ncbi:hypothetical protein GGR51DRAFT_372245 [Nemania sp. FL0031]|nr:hypothetical protein GGR51DRAFT_372245 [Nemania sp. FL0031]
MHVGNPLPLLLVPFVSCIEICGYCSRRRSFSFHGPSRLGPSVFVLFGQGFGTVAHQSFQDSRHPLTGTTGSEAGCSIRRSIIFIFAPRLHAFNACVYDYIGIPLRAFGLSYGLHQPA